MGNESSLEEKLDATQLLNVDATVDFDVTMEHEIPYNPSDISRFMGYTLHKNGDGNPGVYFVREQPLETNRKYFLTSWSQSDEDGEKKDDVELREDEIRVKVDGKEILMAGLIQEKNYEEFRQACKDSGINPREAIRNTMANFCYEPSNRKNTPGEKQVFIYVLAENPRAFVRKELKSIKKVF